MRGSVSTVSAEEWENIPAPKPPKAKDRYEQLLASVGEGKIARVDVKEEKELKGTRIAIARKARNAGFIAEFKNLGNALYVKRSEKPLEKKSEEPGNLANQEEKSIRKKTTKAT